MEYFTNKFSKEIWEKKHKFYGDKDIKDTWKRMAKASADLENDKGKYEKSFYDLLECFKFVPGGRIISNLGTGIKGTTILNCFSGGFDGKDKDSLEGIMNSIKKAGVVLKSEGGYGENFSVLRPRGTYIDGIRGESCGVIDFMDIWDSTASVITKGSGLKSKNKKVKASIRKGATMGILEIWHPDIEEFIYAKQRPGKLTKFNISVGISYGFMDAVINNKEWKCIFPDIHSDINRYKEEWNGNIKEWTDKGYPVKVYKTYKNANELFEKILEATYNRNEPGILFLDRINELNNLHYCERISHTNACSEIPLDTNGFCLLGSINHTQFLKEDLTGYDYGKLKKYIPLMVRFLDNLLEITNAPLQTYIDEALNKRRIGIGHLGYASALALLNIRYGSKEALDITEDLLNFITNEIYKSSSLLAKEKGSFPMLDINKYLQSNFIKQALNEDTIDLISRHGIRNSHLVMVAPTGSTAITSNNVSGGFEPIFSPEYIRTSIIDSLPEELEKVLPKDINKRINFIKNNWKLSHEGDTDTYKLVLNDKVYKYDNDRGITVETTVQDYATKYLKDRGIWEYTKNIIPNVHDLTIHDHLETMKIFAKYTDNSISKTINIGNNVKFKDFKDVYMQAYNSKYIKGCTTYRTGTMASVISMTDKDSKEQKNIEFYDFWKSHKDEIVKKQVKVPSESDSKRYIFKIPEGRKWYFHVSFKDKTQKRPFEIFATTNSRVKNVNTLTVVDDLHKLALELGVPRKHVDQNNIKLEKENNVNKIMRTISLMLRHNVSLNAIIEVLDSIDVVVTSFIFRFRKFLRTFIDGEIDSKNKCVICGGTLRRLEGCSVCMDCGDSKCG